MKIAIVIPGLVRTYKSVYNNFRKNVLDPNEDHQIDIYLAFWDKSAPKKGKAKYINVDDVLETYKPINYKVLNFEPLQKNEIRLLAQTIDKLFKKRYVGLSFIHNGIVSQFYTWNEVINLIPPDNSYDLVFKTRFDLEYQKVIKFSEIDSKYVSCGKKGKWVEKGSMTDYNFISSYNNMAKILTQCWDNINDSSYVSEFNYKSVPEALLTKVVNDLDIPIRYEITNSKLKR